MKYKSEDQIKHKLGLTSWRDFSKDKVMEFVSMMPDMDKEVMIKVIEQFPEFTKFGRNVLDSLNKSTGTLSESNSRDSKEHLKVISQIALTLEKELNKENLDSDERRYIIDQIIKIAEMIKDMDQNNKSFLAKFGEGNFKVAGILGAGALTVLGGRALINKFTDII